MPKYEVKAILDSRRKGKTTEYLVEWSSTWEPVDDLNCHQLISRFEAKSQKKRNKAVDHKEDEPQDVSAQTQTLTRSARKAAKTGERKRRASEKTPKKANTGTKRSNSR